MTADVTPEARQQAEQLLDRLAEIDERTRVFGRPHAKRPLSVDAILAYGAEQRRLEREQIANLQSIPPEHFWAVYDKCRDIGKLAHEVSEFVDNLASLIPEKTALTGAGPGTSRKD